MTATKYMVKVLAQRLRWVRGTLLRLMNPDPLRCRYADCAHTEAGSDAVQVTCPKCREDLGLPVLFTP